MGFMMIHDLVNPKTGKTYKEENLELKHNIPIGTLVEVKWHDWFGDGAGWKVHARLWVISHDRDCDGTPLYSISRWKDFGAMYPSVAFHGFTEGRLTPMEITPELVYGTGSLEWPGREWADVGDRGVFVSHHRR